MDYHPIKYIYKSREIEKGLPARRTLFSSDVVFCLSCFPANVTKVPISDT